MGNSCAFRCSMGYMSVTESWTPWRSYRCKCRRICPILCHKHGFLWNLWGYLGMCIHGCGSAYLYSICQSLRQTDAETGSSTDEEQKTISGTVESIKDFQFVIYDENNSYYQFSFEETPKGLDSVKVGDSVIVTYTGTISEVDPFLGEVISVEPCR